MASSAKTQHSFVNRWHIRHCADVIRSGGVIAYPTEGVWGLGCDPWQEDAVEYLISLKRRQPAKGLILISGDAAHFEPLLVHVAPDQRAQLLEKRARATTWLVPDPAQYFPGYLRGKHETVALRITTHPLVCALTAQLAHPVISTSANLSGHPAAQNALRVRQYFGNQLDALLPGQTAGDARPSQIIDLRSGAIIRS